VCPLDAAQTHPRVDGDAALGVASTIVIGAHGWGAIRRLAFGSVSLALLTNAPCPVLVARGVAEGETTWVDDRCAAEAIEEPAAV
jgi:hypothetical protein